MATWKKVLVSGSNISDLNNDLDYLLAVGDGVVSGSAQITLGGDLVGTANNAELGIGVVENINVANNAGIEYTKIDFTNSNILSGSIDLSGYTTTSSFNSFTSSYYVDSASVSTRVTSLENFSSSLDATFVSETEFTAFTASYKVDSGSWNSSITTLTNASASFASDIIDLVADSASFSTRVTTLEAASASFASDINTLETDLATEIAKTDAYTSSFTTQTLIVTQNAAVTGTFGVQGDTSFGSNVVVEGNLTVNGTASFVNVEELSIKDKFITLASGSNSLTDSGIIFQSSTTGVGSGPSLFLESTSTGAYGRMAMATSVDVNATTATPAAYVTTTEIGVTAPPAAPVFGDTTNGFGNIYVNSSTGEIFIYA